MSHGACIMCNLRTKARAARTLIIHHSSDGGKYAEGVNAAPVSLRFRTPRCQTADQLIRAANCGLHALVVGTQLKINELTPSRALATHVLCVYDRN